MVVLLLQLFEVLLGDREHLLEFLEVHIPLDLRYLVLRLLLGREVILSLIGYFLIFLDFLDLSQIWLPWDLEGLFLNLFVLIVVEFVSLRPILQLVEMGLEAVVLPLAEEFVDVVQHLLRQIVAPDLFTPFFNLITELIRVAYLIRCICVNLIR